MSYLVHVLYSSNLIKKLIQTLMLAGVQLNQSSVQKSKRNKQSELHSHITINHSRSLQVLCKKKDKHNDFSGALPAMDAFDPRADEYLLSTHTRCSGSNAIITSQKVTITHSKTCITALTRIIKGTAIMITWKQFSFAHLQDK